MKFSKTSKMPGRSWSTQALKTCPGSIDSSGNIVDSCKWCYGRTNFYLMPSVEAARKANTEAWKKPEFVNAMIMSMDNDRWFRWFDGGDIVNARQAEKIYQIIKGTPWCNHWLPTHSHKKDKIEVILKKIEKLPNAMVRRSSDSIDGVFEDIHGSVIFRNPHQLTAEMTECRAKFNDNKCGTCRACWSKDVKLIGYHLHGREVKGDNLKEVKIIERERKQKRLIEMKAA